MCKNPNMNVWVQVQDTPTEARKPIQAGRLKGMTDINPMWRFKKLTETFGPCGIGWKYEIANKWLETGLETEVKAFVEVHLYIRDGENWSAAIPGIGGSSFVTVERSGPYCSDECYKMALTDAISVCCKALGMSADIYFANDRDKYTENDEIAAAAKPPRNDNRKDDGPAPGRQTAITEPEEQMGTCKHCGKPTPVRILMANRERCRQPFCDMCTEDYIAWKKKQAEGKENNNAQ